MNMRIKILILSFVGLILTGNLRSQTAQWAIRPTSAQLEGYGNLLKVRKNGKCGLIDRNNQEIIPARYDSISPFLDGYALAMNYSGKQLKIIAVISESDYDIQALTENLYATRYMWFSDGKMPVKGENGWGYLGTDGNLAIPCQFQMAFPFSEGLASVLIDDKAYYIDRNMDYLPVEVGYGNLVFASTFSGEEAIVYSGYSLTPKGYVINRRGRTVRPYKVKANELKVNKFDHSVGDKAHQLKEQVQQLKQDERYTIFQENGLYGYKRNGQLVIPAQLDRAEPVKGGYANVRFKGQNGVLRMLDGKLSVQLENNQIEVNNKSISKGIIQVNLPTALADASILLRMVDAEGDEMFIKGNVTQGEHRSYSFSPTQNPQKNETRLYKVEVYNDNLLIWRGNYDITYTVANKTQSTDMGRLTDSNKTIEPEMTIASLTISPPRASSKRANPKNDFYVTVTVSNSGDKRGIGNVSLFVDGQQVGSKSIGVRGHGQANALFAISGIRKERYAKVKATLKNGRTSHEANIHFMPFN